MSDGLLPCPFCAGTNFDQLANCVECLDCGARGPTQEEIEILCDPDFAKEQWNRRAFAALIAYLEEAEAATLRAEVERLRKALDDEKKMRRSGVKAAFEEGFVRGADDGWLNNPRMEREWRRSSAKMGLKT